MPMYAFTCLYRYVKIGFCKHTHIYIDMCVFKMYIIYIYLSMHMYLWVHTACKRKGYRIICVYFGMHRYA